MNDTRARARHLAAVQTPAGWVAYVVIVEYDRASRTEESARETVRTLLDQLVERVNTYPDDMHATWKHEA
jgi:hypothetical protein